MAQLVASVADVDARRTGETTRPSGSPGFSVTELVIVLALVSSLIGLGVPPLLQGARMKETADAAAYLAGQFRLCRQRAVMTGKSLAVVFNEEGTELGWRICHDEDGDGVSRGDVEAGRDRCEPTVERLSQRFPHVRPGYHPGVPPISGTSMAAVRFGNSRMAVFTPLGTSSSGSLVLMGAGGTQVAIRVSGVTGRTRTLRFVRAGQGGAGRWED